MSKRIDGDSSLNPEDEAALLRSLRSPTLRLLAAILKTASGDWYCLKERMALGAEYCDRTHNGYEELRYFFYSEWFDRICDEFDFEPETIREKICID